MTCITDGVLRAKIDGELSAAEWSGIEQHLESCPDCRRRAASLAEEAGRVRDMLSALAPLPGELPGDAGMALARFKANRIQPTQESASLWARVFARRWAPAWGAAVVAGLIVVLVSFAPARSWAQRILAMLRVQKVAVVSLDTTALPQPGADSRAAKMISQLISDDVVVTVPSQKPQAAASGEEASQLAGFRVRLLSDRTEAPQISVEGEHAFHMTVNRDRLQAVLGEIGHPELELPASLNGAVIAVQIPKSVFARYGNCPENRKDESSSLELDHPRGEQAPGGAGSKADFSSCVVLAEVPSPAVSVPPNLNIAQLAEVGLQAAGMSADEAHAFCQTVDWSSTLVIPIPSNATSYEKQEVDGVEGTLIRESSFGRRHLPGYTLIWVKNGIIYSIFGVGDSSNALALADSLS